MCFSSINKFERISFYYRCVQYQTLISLTMLIDKYSKEIVRYKISNGTDIPINKAPVLYKNWSVILLGEFQLSTN